MSENLPNENSDKHKLLKLLNSGENVFITGVAGTGKSYLLSKLKELYKKQIIITSTTGISAVNIGGQTIHHWAGVECMETPVEDFCENIRNQNFGYFGKIKRRIRNCKILAIDEISMLSAYALEYLDLVFKSARENNEPFGGIQVILIGDFLQLPPVATELDIQRSENRAKYCFESIVWQNLDLKPILLKKIYRQTDLRFSNMLCNFRIGQITENDMKLLEKRFVDDDDLLNNKLHIFSKKIQVKCFNDKKLEELSTPIFDYKSYDEVFYPDDVENHQEYRYKMIHDLNKYCQAEQLLRLKVGARVMLLANIDINSGLANGTCGTVEELAKSYAIVKFDNGLVKKIGSYLFEYQIDDIVLAKRFQLPLKLAYAVTIHKSQGMTFDEIVINCASSFSPGQVYVGLSRVKTLNGLYITGFNPQKMYPSNIARAFYLKLDDEEMEKFKEDLFRRYR